MSCKFKPETGRTFRRLTLHITGMELGSCLTSTEYLLPGLPTPSRNPSYAYRNCVNASWAWSRSESRSNLLLKKCFGTFWNVSSLAAHSLCCFLSASLVCGSNRNSSFKLCSSGGATRCSITNRHFRYNSTENAPMTPYVTASRILLFNIASWMSWLASSNTTAAWNIRCGSGAGLPCFGFTE